MSSAPTRPGALTTRFSYLLTNLTSNSSYSLMIRSRNYLGWSKLSEKVTFDTFPSPGKLCLMLSCLTSCPQSPRALRQAGFTPQPPGPGQGRPHWSSH